MCVLFVMGLLGVLMFVSQSTWLRKTNPRHYDIRLSLVLKYGVKLYC